MTELIGDICRPSEFLLPPMNTSEADTMSNAGMLSATMIFNTDLAKAEVFSGGGWETITSVAR